MCINCNNILMLYPVVRNTEVSRLKKASVSLPVQPPAQSRAHFKVRPWPDPAKFCNLWGQRFHSVVHWPWEDAGCPPKPPYHSSCSAGWRRESLRKGSWVKIRAERDVHLHNYNICSCELEHPLMSPSNSDKSQRPALCWLPQCAAWLISVLGGNLAKHW